MSGAGAQARVLGELLAWINRRLAPPGCTVTADTPLFDGGLINSMKILELIAWTERASGRPIPDRDIRMDNFATARRITQAFGREAIHADV